MSEISLTFFQCALNWHRVQGSDMFERALFIEGPSFFPLPLGFKAIRPGGT